MSAGFADMNRRLEAQREADRIAQARPDVITTHVVSRTCPPFAALLHRLAALITAEDLPPASVRVDGLHGQVFVDASGCELVENVVRRYAAALDLGPVTEVPVDGPSGLAAVQWSASSYDGSGVWFLVSGEQLLPVPVTDRFGVGVGPST